jgi:hypothetical protein
MISQVIEDHRPFNTDVSIETFFKNCGITFCLTKDAEYNQSSKALHYICRYRLMSLSKRRLHIEPIMEEERKALLLLGTPSKTFATPSKNITPSKTPKTPTSLVKKMSRVSLQEQKNWSVSKNDGTKLLLKRAILADQNEKNSPRKTPKCTPTITDTPTSSKKLSKRNIEDVLSMELKENSDDELPTLIIRQHIRSTPKRKQSISKTNEETPKKLLFFDDDEKTEPTKDTYSTRSGRITKATLAYSEHVSPMKRTPRSSRTKPVSYVEQESPVKQTPKKPIVRNLDNEDEDFKPIPRTPRTPRTPKIPKTPLKTPKRNVTRKIIGDLTPSLQSRAHSIDNVDSE